MTVVICDGVNRRYAVRVRYSGFRKYELLSTHRSRRAALRRLADAMASGSYDRGDVLMSADYYDPVQVWEVMRR